MKNLLGTVSYSVLTSLVLLSNVNAACPVSRSTANTASSTLIVNPGDRVRNNTVCVTFREKSQEFHKDDGDLIDWKLGPADSTNQNDPRKSIGSWTSDEDSITYTYPSSNGDKVYSYNMYVDLDAVPTKFYYCFGTNGAGNIPIDKIIVGTDQC